MHNRAAALFYRFIIGVSTSRAEQNSLSFIDTLNPDILITSGGALVKYRGTYIYTAEFTAAVTKTIIDTARDLCGTDCEITIDTLDAHYWNYRIDPLCYDSSWGDTIYADYDHFTEKALKICVQTADPKTAKTLADKFPDWCESRHISPQEIIAFGDDLPDVGMLRLCGLGIAMGNALDAVKQAADMVIGSNDEDGLANYLVEHHLL